MTLSDPESYFQGHSKGEYLANGSSDPLQVWF